MQLKLHHLRTKGHILKENITYTYKTSNVHETVIEDIASEHTCTHIIHVAEKGTTCACMLVREFGVPVFKLLSSLKLDGEFSNLLRPVITALLQLN